MRPFLMERSELLLHPYAKCGALSFVNGRSGVARESLVVAGWYAGRVLPSALPAPACYDAFDSADDGRKRAVRAVR